MAQNRLSETEPGADKSWQGVTREGGIRRMVYPLSFSQSADDRANYEEALNLLGGADKDKAITQLWWDCKNRIY